jgi:hypothetical protein
MRQLTFTLTLVAAVMGAALSACSSAAPAPAEDTSPRSEKIVFQAETANQKPADTPTPTLAVEIGQPEMAATANLPTEIIEAVSPVVPVSPVSTPDKTMMVPVQPAAVPLPPGSEAAIAAAVADLTTTQGLPPDQLTVLSVTATDWPDTSLGCPQEGMMYAQVITPGYLIILQAQGQQYEYHTNQTGQNVILCQK